MSNKFIFFTGILGVGLFVSSSIIGGLLMDEYNSLSQYISETYAIDTKYGMKLRIFGIIPSGILLTVFCFATAKKFKSFKLAEIGYYGLGIFYGLATVIVGFFPCDSGCNKEFINPSISQIIHNLIGFMTYLFVPIFIILIGYGLRSSQHYPGLSKKAIGCGIISILFMALLFADTESAYIGLYQRIVETMFVIWIIASAFAIKNRIPDGNKVN